MPSDDFQINVRQINGFPFQPNAGFGDAVLLQTTPNGPFYQMSAQGLVASALENDPVRGLGVGASLPPGAGGNILAANSFVAPLEQGILFNCFLSSGGVSSAVSAIPLPVGLTYFAPGPAGQLTFADEGFAFLGAPSGPSLTPITAWDAAMTVSRTGQVAVRQQLTVGRAPVGPSEVVSLSYLWNFAIVRDLNNGKLNLTTQDILDAGGATAVNAMLAGYPRAQTPLPEAHNNEIATAEWVMGALTDGRIVSTFNGRGGAILLTLFDIALAGGAQLLNPHFEGEPRAPTPLSDDSSDRLATTSFVRTAINNALAGAKP